MRKTYFIINPEAGNKQGLKLQSQIDELWQNAEIDHEIYITSSHSDIAAGVEKAVKEDATEIVVAGGDGTILAVVNALDGRSIPIGVVPCGTGNDFVRSHGVSSDIQQALKDVLYAEAFTEVDIGNCNGSHFLNVASVGIDAAIVKRTQKVKKWLNGPIVYLAASIIEILIYKPMDISITIDGVARQHSVELVAVANGRFYGGGMEIAPMADSCDGMYDVILIHKMKKSRLLRLLPTLYSGSHIYEKEVEILRGKNIQIQYETIMDINMDGELTYGNIMHVEKVQQKIKVIAKL